MDTGGAAGSAPSPAAPAPVVRPWRILALQPLWAGLSASLGVGLPFLAPLLLPLGTSRLVRASLALPSLWQRFAVAALTPFTAFVTGLFVMPGGSWITAIVATAFVALPAAAMVAGAAPGRRRDDLLLLVAALTGVGALAILLGTGLATGNDPGGLLAARFQATVPEMITTYRSLGWSESSLATLGRVFDLFRHLLSEQLPGAVLATCVVYAAVLVYPAGRLAGLPIESLASPLFSQLSTPLAAAVAFVPLGLVTALGPPGLRQVAVDLLLPLGFLFFLRGLAIIRVLLDRGGAGVIGRTLVYVLVAQMPFPLLLALGGLFDEFFNIRGRLDRAARSRESDDGNP